MVPRLSVVGPQRGGREGPGGSPIFLRMSDSEQPYDPNQTNMVSHIQRFFNAGDYIEYFITQNHGGATASLSSASFGTRVFARWLAVS